MPLSHGNWIADLGNGSYRNPILYTDYSDPDVIRVGDDFFMTASSFTFVPGLPILHSKDLVNWELINYAARRLPEVYDTPQHGCGVWAPSMRFHDGRYYIYYGDPDYGYYMTSTDDPYGEWDELTLIKSAKGTIDTCPFWDDDGKAYIVHAYAGSRTGGFKSRLAICEMTPDGKEIISEDTVVFNGEVSHTTLEGPKMYKRGEYYYILAPAGGVPIGWQVALRSKNIYGPYEDRIVLRMGLTEINGPHQGALVELESGESWFLHFQDLEAYGRIIHLQPVQWMDGWPVMGERVDDGYCGQPVMEYKKPDVGGTYPITTVPAGDSFDKEELDLQWQWQANPQESWYSLTANPGSLRLYGQGVKEGMEGHLWNMPNVLTQLWHAPQLSATVRVELPDGDENTYAGIAIEGLTYNYIAINGKGRISHMRGVVKQYSPLEVNDAGITEAEDGDTFEYEVASADAGTTAVYLRAEVMGQPNGKTAPCRMLYSTDGRSFTQLGDIFYAREGKWVGAKLALFCAGDSFADFGEFTVE